MLKENNSKDRLLTVKEMAARRGCSIATVWRHVKLGLIAEPIRIGGLTRWSEQEDDEYIAAFLASRKFLPKDRNVKI